MKTEQQAISEQKKLHPLIKPKAMTQEVTMIVPGPRALGIEWERVTLGHDGNNIVERREAAEAPATGQPVMALSGPDAGYAEEIMQALLEKAQEKAKNVDQLSQAEAFAAVNEAWHAHIEQKLRWMKGMSSMGAGGFIQRQRVTQNPGSRPAHR